MIRTVPPAMTSRPAVSVLLTTYRHEAYVEQALDSVAAQTFQDLELIITDDCSQDGTAERIRGWLARTGYTARFIHNTRNMGICAVRNQALALARGTYVCGLAGDDWYEPDRLERQHGFFSSLPEDVAFVYSDVRMLDPVDAVLEPSFLQHYLGPGVAPPEAAIFERLLRGNFLPGLGVMIRRSALDSIGGYDESLAYEDYDMWLRLAHAYAVRFFPGVVANYRVLPTSMSHSEAWKQKLATSTLSILSRWVGVEPSQDAWLARNLLSQSLQVAQFDLPAAREALRPIPALPTTRTLRMLATVLAIPGTPRLLNLLSRARIRMRVRCLKSSGQKNGGSLSR
jgi:GT2 family glycosyltransferase